MNILINATHEQGYTISHLVKSSFEQAGRNVEAFTPMQGVPLDWRYISETDFVGNIEVLSAL